MRSRLLSAGLLTLVLSGCAQYQERKQEEARAQVRSEFLHAHPTLPTEIATGIRSGNPVIGMNIYELEAALGSGVSLVRTSSDGTEVHRHWRAHVETIYYFEGGKLANWDCWDDRPAPVSFPIY